MNNISNFVAILNTLYLLFIYILLQGNELNITVSSHAIWHPLNVFHRHSGNYNNIIHSIILIHTLMTIFCFYSRQCMMHADFNSNMIHLSPVIVPQHKSLCGTMFHELFISCSCVYAVVDNDVTITESTASSCNDPSWLTSRVITDNWYTLLISKVYISLLTSLIFFFLYIAIQEKTKPMIRKEFCFSPYFNSCILYAMKHIHLFECWHLVSVFVSVIDTCWTPTRHASNIALRCRS